MKKAEKLNTLVDEVKNPVHEFKSGDLIQFKKGSDDEGLQGYLVDQNKDGSWNLKLGNATRKEVKDSEIEMVSNSATKD